MTINPATLSKINWTNGIAFFATLGTVFGLDIDPALQLKIVGGLAVATQLATVILRTFFTAKTPIA